ncbi:PREDICTED: uncharacterized protein C9orf85 homolog [Dinoponera quadriceps]|uniref:Uncharacterized protein C9orf85 homolog n=1 Tax=Dinoponera quadriceps TaxID=609295 RepID=A0A6P3XRL1_DINQU|nr:PREDICTED: uncharacterized protein C9orf85 homolog [Dinoponera quadriceps]XP_014480704.1 PREDICTED: uncharacterized protein C9orf85 homolog [Dinoponera quadriceps]
MSCQRGNGNRSRRQKYQNHTAFKNDLHDKSQKTKSINSIEVANVCERCKKIIEWKIKYKKYKALKTPAKCTKCEQKAIKHSYHIMCLPCAKQREVCPKCGLNSEIVEGKPSKEEQIKLDTEFQTLLKTLPERKRRTFLRYVNQKDKSKKKDTSESGAGEIDGNDTNEDATNSRSREDLLTKLKLLSVKEEEDDDSFDSDIDDDLDSLT